jgi:outer membrane immunogenic protein
MGWALTAAQAADVIPEPAPAFNWTAFHIGVGGGGGWNSYDADTQGCFDFGDDCEDGDLDNADLILDHSADLGSGLYGFGTVEAGFDYDFGGFVIGILGNYDFNADSSASSEAHHENDDGEFTTSEIEAELDDTWFVGGRLGATVGGLTGGDNTSLIYVLGGYTWADGNVKAFHEFDDDDGDDVIEIDEDESVDGWTIGGGIETMLWEAVSLKVEYRHDFLDDIDIEGECGTDDDGPDCENLGDANVDFSRDTVRAVLSWRFGGFWE